MSKTACIVNPGRAVRHEGKRHAEGAVLRLDQVDVKQLTENGFVSIWTPSSAPLGTDTAETGRQAIDNFVQALADGHVTEGKADDLPKVDGDQQTKSSSAPDAKSNVTVDAPAKTTAAKTPSRRR